MMLAVNVLNRLFSTIGVSIGARPRVLVLALLFVLVQFATVLHASEHPFHVEDASCDAFLAVEKSKSSLVDSGATVTTSYFIDSISAGTDAPFVSNLVTAYQSRAPPRRSFF